MFEFYIGLAATYLAGAYISVMISTSFNNESFRERLFNALLWPLFTTKFLIKHTIIGLYKALKQLLLEW